VQKGLALLPSEVGIGIAKNEADGCEEVTLAGTIAANNNVVFRGEWLNDRLVLVARLRLGSTFCSHSRSN
jgi:hypothetical protein